MNLDLFVLRRSVATLLAAAAVELFPGTLLCGGGSTAFGFYYDFLFPFPFQKIFLTELTEKMRALQKEGREVQCIEMVPDNAAALFESLSQIELARQAKERGPGLVSLVRMGDFYDFSNGSFAQVGPFKLLAVREKEGRVRIFGGAEAEAHALKKRKAPPEKGHLEWGSEQELFALPGEEVIWETRGALVCRELKKVWLQAHTDEKFHLIEGMSFPWASLSAYHHIHPEKKRIALWGIDQSVEERCAEGLLTPKMFTTDMSIAFCPRSELAVTCFSSLQLIIKILKMLDFEFEMVLSSVSSKNLGAPLLEALREGGWSFREERAADEVPRLDVFIPDGTGVLWRCSSLEIALPQGEQKTFGVVHSVFAKLERVVALLLERKEGRLPFWLAPEQISLFIIDERALSFGEEIACDLEQMGVRVQLREVQKGDLNRYVHEGLKRKIPFIAVIGNRERETERITVRTLEALAPQSVTKEELIRTIQEESH